MKMQKMTIALLCVCFAWMVVAAFRNSTQHERRIKIDSEFLQIGKKIAEAIVTNYSVIPKNAGELKAARFLSDPEWQFFQKQKVIYIPPSSISNSTLIILIMPKHDNGPERHIDLSGFMSSSDGR